MAGKTSGKENRSQVAEACVEFGSQLLKTRLSSTTPTEIQQTIKELFDWLDGQDAFLPGNTRIALASIRFGMDLLEHRKTCTAREAIDAIQSLYQGLV